MIKNELTPQSKARSGSITEHKNSCLKDWPDQAACASTQIDPGIFYPPERRGAPGGDRIRAAKKICQKCPVSEQCLAAALSGAEEHGIWGGFTAIERRKMLLTS
ncbi:WhiB family transcriptional regulator [Streptomyces sp900105245]|uniref:Transcriptional regulator WhiB n=1 Tax=Streptomyces sp. 900105245 TaxID=3154379 RepID=A0ABV1ULP5_9ACTN